MDYEVLEHSWVPMPDGVRLSMRLWLPEQRPAPVVLEYIPYRKRDLYRSTDDFHGHRFASAGLAFARVDVRGSGDSEGELVDEYTEDELTDGVCLIDWLARQGWCSGQVGLRGLSWGAINALRIATRRPKALTGVVALAGTDDRFSHDAHLIGGRISRCGVQWGNQFRLVRAAPPDPEIFGSGWYDAWLARLNGDVGVLRRWLENRDRTGYWSDEPVDLSPIDVPVCLVAGWGDTYATPILRIRDSLRTRSQLVMGPWDHTYPDFAVPTGMRWVTAETVWWQAAFSGQTTPWSGDWLSIPETGNWLNPDDSSRITNSRALRLAADGSLSAEQAEPTWLRVPDTVRVGGCTAEWLDQPAAEQSRDDEASLLFDTLPLTEPLQLLGSVEVCLLVRGGLQSGVVARLTRVDTNGRSTLLAWGAEMHAHEETAEGLLVTVRMLASAGRAMPGQRLRLALSRNLWPVLWPAPRCHESLFVASGASTLRLPCVDANLSPSDLPEILSVRNRNGARFPVTTVSEPQLGTLRAERSEGPATFEVADTATRITRSLEESGSVSVEDPSDCVWSGTAKQRWQRADWDCEVEVGYSLSERGAGYVLREWLEARQGGVRVFARSSDAEFD